MTTPLRESFDKVVAQVGAYHEGRKALQKPPVSQALSMLIMLFVTESSQQTEKLARLALERHRRFLNVFGGEGEVTGGAIKPYDTDLTIEDIKKNLIIGSPEECAARLRDYAALGIDDIQLNMNFGAPHAEVMRSLELFATRVMPEFDK
jgi:alkanesulfonate monooxygenase SsuD/methylene tetrahydromethanopterin reductase-like flavin-dependent oxidoreductase (luciferase family)